MEVSAASAYHSQVLSFSDIIYFAVSRLHSTFYGYDYKCPVNTKLVLVFTWH